MVTVFTVLFTVFCSNSVVFSKTKLDNRTKFICLHIIPNIFYVNVAIVNVAIVL